MIYIKKGKGEVKMNYVYPTRNAFIVPHGTTLKRKKESLEIKEQRALLRKCLDKKLSIDGKKVYNTKPSKHK